MGAHKPSLESDPEQIAKEVAAAAGAPAMRVVLAPQDRAPLSANREIAAALRRRPAVRADMLFWLLVSVVVAGAFLLVSGLIE